VQVLVGPVTLDQGSVHEVVRILHELVVDERGGVGTVGGIGVVESSRVAEKRSVGMSGGSGVTRRMFDDFELDDGWRVNRSCVRVAELSKTVSKRRRSTIKMRPTPRSMKTRKKTYFDLLDLLWLYHRPFELVSAAA
jgi:hypothetical protein